MCPQSILINIVRFLYIINVVCKIVIMVSVYNSILIYVLSGLVPPSQLLSGQ